MKTQDEQEFGAWVEARLRARGLFAAAVEALPAEEQEALCLALRAFGVGARRRKRETPAQEAAGALLALAWPKRREA